MTKLMIEIDYPDSAAQAVMCTALEGGIGYWCQARKLKETEHGYESAELAELDDSGDDYDWDLPLTLDANVIRNGIRKILNGEVKIRKDLRDQVFRDATTAGDYDSWDVMDADAADCVVQAGLLGELRYS